MTPSRTFAGFGVKTARAEPVIVPPSVDSPCMIEKDRPKPGPRGRPHTLPYIPVTSKAHGYCHIYDCLADLADGKVTITMEEMSMKRCSKNIRMYGGRYEVRTHHATLYNRQDPKAWYPHG